MTSTDPAAAAPPKTRFGDEWAYMAPMFAFLILVFVGGNWESLYPASYVARVVLVTGLLVYFWKQYTRISWNGWWLGILVGVVGIFQWVGMQLFLQKHFDHFKPGPDPFNPFNTFSATWAQYAFIAVRIAGAVLVVPVMEELFWRDFLWRTIIAPNDFKLAKVGEVDWKAILVVCGFFATVHGNWWLTAVVWAAMIAALLIYTRSIGACIIAHAVTNLLLAAYVLYYKDWGFW